MPQQNGYLPITADNFVSDMDYSEARHILDLTTTKQKQRSRPLSTQLLLKRTYTHVCQLLDSECLIKKPLPLSTVDTNKRKLSSDNHEVLSSLNKKCKSLMNNDILQFLHELNAVKVLPRY